MKRIVEGEDRSQVTLLPKCLDDYIAEDNPVRVVDAFVEELDLQAPGFEDVEPAETGRPSDHPSLLPKIYIYGYLNRVQSSGSKFKARHEPPDAAFAAAACGRSHRL
jgi:transposase